MKFITKAAFPKREIYDRFEPSKKESLVYEVPLLRIWVNYSTAQTEQSTHLIIAILNFLVIVCGLKQ